MSDDPRTLAADIAMIDHRVAQEDQMFENMLSVLKAAYAQRMPEALAKGETMRDSYLQMAVNIEKQCRLAQSRARRHVQRAERIGEILELNRKRNLIRARHGATPEVLAKPRSRDPIAMLVEKGKLDTGQERAAREIATIYQAVVAALMPRIASLDASKGPGRGCSEDRMAEDIAIWHHDRYIPWARALAKKDNICLPLVIDVAVDGVAVNTACRQRQVGYR